MSTAAGNFIFFESLEKKRRKKRSEKRKKANISGRSEFLSPRIGRKREAATSAGMAPPSRKPLHAARTKPPPSIRIFSIESAIKPKWLLTRKNITSESQ